MEEAPHRLNFYSSASSRSSFGRGSSLFLGEREWVFPYRKIYCGISVVLRQGKQMNQKRTEDITKE